MKLPRCIPCLGHTTFESALRQGNVAAALAHLEHDPLHVARSGFTKGNTLWHVAAKGGHVPLLRALLDRLSEVWPRPPDEPVSPAVNPFQRRSHPFQRISDGLRGRHSAHHHVTLISFLNTANVLGQTPLMVACQRGHADAVHFLLEAGANAWARDRGQCTALHYAVVHDQPPCIEAVLQHPASARPPPAMRQSLVRLVDLGNFCGYTPVHYAAASGRPRALVALLAAGAHVAPRSWAEGHDWISGRRGSTPLHLAARRGDTAMCRLIMRHYLECLRDGGGVDPRVHADGRGWRPFQLAEERGNPQLAKMLMPWAPLTLMFRDGDAVRLYKVPKLKALAAAALQAHLLASINGLEAVADARRRAAIEATYAAARSATGASVLGGLAGRTGTGGSLIAGAAGRTVTGGSGVAGAAGGGAAAGAGALAGAASEVDEAAALAALSRAPSLRYSVTNAMDNMRRQSLRSVRSIGQRLRNLGRADSTGIDARGSMYSNADVPAGGSAYGSLGPSMYGGLGTSMYGALATSMYSAGGDAAAGHTVIGRSNYTIPSASSMQRNTGAIYEAVPYLSRAPTATRGAAAAVSVPLAAAAAAVAAMAAGSGRYNAVAPEGQTALHDAAAADPGTDALLPTFHGYAALRGAYADIPTRGSPDAESAGGQTPLPGGSSPVGGISPVRGVGTHMLFDGSASGGDSPPWLRPGGFSGSGDGGAGQAALPPLALGVPQLGVRPASPRWSASGAALDHAAGPYQHGTSTAGAEHVAGAGAGAVQPAAGLSGAGAGRGGAGPTIARCASEPRQATAAHAGYPGLERPQPPAPSAALSPFAAASVQALVGTAVQQQQPPLRTTHPVPPRAQQPSPQPASPAGRSPPSSHRHVRALGAAGAPPALGVGTLVGGGGGGNGGAGAGFSPLEAFLHRVDEHGEGAHGPGGEELHTGGSDGALPALARAQGQSRERSGLAEAGASPAAPASASGLAHTSLPLPLPPQPPFGGATGAAAPPAAEPAGGSPRSILSAARAAAAAMLGRRSQEPAAGAAGGLGLSRRGSGRAPTGGGAAAAAAAAVLQGVPSGGLAPAATILGSDTSEDLCGICFERPVALHVVPCRHLLCAQCSREVTRMVSTQPPSCPYCRGLVRGFGV